MAKRYSKKTKTYKFEQSRLTSAARKIQLGCERGVNELKLI